MAAQVYLQCPPGHRPERQLQAFQPGIAAAQGRGPDELTGPGTAEEAIRIDVIAEPVGKFLKFNIVVRAVNLPGFADLLF